MMCSTLYYDHLKDESTRFRFLIAQSISSATIWFIDQLTFPVRFLRAFFSSVSIFMALINQRVTTQRNRGH